MRNLLSAHFLRLKKNHLFWAALAVGAALAGFRVHTLWRDHIDVGVVSTLDEGLFTYAQLVGLTVAVFASLFLGTEYSDGTIRNKVISGCSRVTIYLSGFLTVSAASVLSLAAYWIVALGMGIPLLEPSQISVGGALFTALGVLLMTGAFCAIFTFITINCSSKTTSAVVCILLFLALLIASTYVYSRLDAPEFVSNYNIVNGELVASEPVPNPRYLQPGPRAVFEFLCDLLPTGQGTQYSVQAVAHPVRLILCSLGVTAVFTGAGAVLFRRKDLK
ncbi:MAG: ABC transporter permease [Oscillospiraceae bacterium]|nr:ABC transporter permease [Oscillospiraceae bacterium]